MLDGGDFNGISSAPDDGIKSNWWNPKWITFTHNGGGDHLCIDLDPSPNGVRGQVISMWHDMEERELKAPNFGAWFEDYVAGVLAGKYVYSEEYGGLIDVDYA